MRLDLIVKMSTWVKLASEYCACIFVTSACSCMLKRLAAWLCAETQPSESSFEGSVPNFAMFCGRHPSGPVL